MRTPENHRINYVYMNLLFGVYVKLNLKTIRKSFKYVLWLGFLWDKSKRRDDLFIFQQKFRKFSTSWLKMNKNNKSCLKIKKKFI